MSKIKTKRVPYLHRVEEWANGKKVPIYRYKIVEVKEEPTKESA